MAALLVAGCSSRGAAPVPDAGSVVAEPVAVVTAPVAEPPPFAPEVRSLVLKRSIVVRMAPTDKAERYGTIAAGTRVAWKQVVKGEGCAAHWVEIEPYGWVCESYLQPSKRWPRGVEVPRLAADEILPGVYGKVIAEEVGTYVREEEAMVQARTLTGSIMLRRYGELIAPRPPVSEVGGTASEVGGTASEVGGTSPEVGGTASEVGGTASEVGGTSPGSTTPEVGGTASEVGGTSSGVGGTASEVGGTGADGTGADVPYWRITARGKHEYVLAREIREFRPSEFRGVRLADDTGLGLPLGFPLSPKRISAKVPVYSAARGGRVVGQVKGREPLPVLEIVAGDDGRPQAYRIGEGRWVRAAEMRLAQVKPPPPGMGATERWMDIDLDEQVLVAYEGQLPVYATLVSTGSRKHPTETGVYRIWVKFAETDMSDLAGEDPYAVATVPWTQFYAKDLALHTAYWHDTFGTPRSHGCTNLSPMDARFLYFWSGPEVPRGWSMAKGTVEHPGSLVRLRSRADPDPPFRGYAARLREAATTTN